MKKIVETQLSIRDLEVNSDYIKNSSKNFKTTFKEKSLGNIQVIIKDDLPKDFNIDISLKAVKDSVPEKFLKNIDYIFVGDFEEFRIKSVNALYMEGAIYVTNNQDDELDLVDDIIHEIAHAVEEERFLEIYSDGSLEREFLAKRERLFHLLDTEGYDLNYQDFKNPEYSNNFDNVLYFDIGYAALTPISMNLFYSPYAITSLREYFANGFEAFYFHKDLNKLLRISPTLYTKLEKLHKRSQ